MSGPSRSSALPSVVVPGNHDGVHVGHIALLQRARALAEVRGARVVALTFDPHPLAFLAPERAPEPLTTIERRVELLRAAGADEVVVARFDASYAGLSAEAWVDGELRERLGACAVVLGADFRFGRGRAGTPSFLREYGATRGLEVVEVDAIGGGTHERVSSTAIRAALREGDVALAATLLTRPHTCTGEVVEGHKRGRTIGVPTANLAPPREMLPRDGVYAVRVDVLGEPAVGREAAGVANLGVRPTFAAGRSLEVHLLDFEGDLYGRTVRVAFVDRLRDEQRFAGVDALVAQIHRDIAEARARLAR